MYCGQCKTNKMDSEVQTEWAMGDPIISELLLWMSFVISWVDVNLIFKLCCDTFSENVICSTLEMLTKLVIPDGVMPAFKKRLSPKTTDSKSIKALNVIYQIFQEYPDKIKQCKFVAADLGQLPPIPLESVDASGIFKGYKNLEVQVGVITECSKSTETILGSMLESHKCILQRLDALESKTNPCEKSISRPFACSECGSDYRSEDELRSHMTQHTKENINAINNNDQAKCKNNAKKEELHKPINSDDLSLPKPLSTRISETMSSYSCNECDSKYSRWEDLQTHQKCHTKEKNEDITKTNDQSGKQSEVYNKKVRQIDNQNKRQLWYLQIREPGKS